MSTVHLIETLLPQAYDIETKCIAVEQAEDSEESKRAVQTLLRVMCECGKQFENVAAAWISGGGLQNLELPQPERALEDMQGLHRVGSLLDASISGWPPPPAADRLVEMYRQVDNELRGNLAPAAHELTRHVKMLTKDFCELARSDLPGQTASRSLPNACRKLVNVMLIVGGLMALPATTREFSKEVAALVKFIATAELNVRVHESLTVIKQLEFEAFTGIEIPWAGPPGQLRESMQSAIDSARPAGIRAILKEDSLLTFVVPDPQVLKEVRQLALKRAGIKLRM